MQHALWVDSIPNFPRQTVSQGSQWLTGVNVKTKKSRGGQAFREGLSTSPGTCQSIKPRAHVPMWVACLPRSMSVKVSIDFLIDALRLRPLTCIGGHLFLFINKLGIILALCHSDSVVRILASGMGSTTSSKTVICTPVAVSNSLKLNSPAAQPPIENGSQDC